MSVEAEIVKEIIEKRYWDAIITRSVSNGYLESLETILRGAKEIGLNEDRIKEVQAGINICKGDFSDEENFIKYGFGTPGVIQ